MTRPWVHVGRGEWLASFAVEGCGSDLRREEVREGESTMVFGSDLAVARSRGLTGEEEDEADWLHDLKMEEVLGWV